MNAPAVITPAYANRLPAETFAAWRVLSNGTSQPLDILGRSSLADVVEAAMLGCQHKDHFSVVQTKANGSRIEHLFYVKAGAAKYVIKPGSAHETRINPLKPEHLFSRAMQTIAPVEMWVCGRGADVVGVNRGLVEAGL
jgi:hypothetical protein